MAGWDAGDAALAGRAMGGMGYWAWVIFIGLGLHWLALDGNMPLWGWGTPHPSPPPPGEGIFLFSLRWLRFGGGAALASLAWVEGRMGRIRSWGLGLVFSWRFFSGLRGRGTSLADWFAWVGVLGMGWRLALVMDRSLHRFSTRRGRADFLF